jgi:predicted PurR-regulated permease PerM
MNPQETPATPPTTFDRQRAGWLVAVAAVVMLWLLWQHAAIVGPFAISAALAYVLRPAMTWLERKHWPRTLAIAVLVTGAGLLAGLLLLLVVPIVMDLAPRLKDQLPELADKAWQGISPWLLQAGFKVPHDLAELKPLLGKVLATHGEEWTQAALNSLKVGGSALLTLIGLVALVPLLTFYWLLDWESIKGRAAGLMPPRWREPAGELINEADGVMGRYLRGQLVVMLALAVYYSLGLMAFGFEQALPIGVFTGLAVFIPYLGFGLGLILAILSGVLQFSAEGAAWWWPFLAVGCVYGVGQVIESVWLTPRCVGEQIGLHPMAVVLALMLFGAWMGFIGVLVALPASALGLVLMRRLLGRYQQSAWYNQGDRKP